VYCDNEDSDSWFINHCGWLTVSVTSESAAQGNADLKFEYLPLPIPWRDT
jgi:hypothetical protein